MLKKMLAVMALFGLSPAYAQSDTVRIIDANQAAKCKFIDTIAANARGSDISDLSDKARTRAMAAAASKGANALVIKGLQPAGSFVLLLADAYACPN